MYHVNAQAQCILYNVVEEAAGSYSLSILINVYINE